MRRRPRHPVTEESHDVRSPSPSSTELQRLTAHVQHKLNNPLAALLAEAQLLGMDESLSREHRESIGRIIGLVRRVIGVVRSLDTEGASDRPG